MFKRKSKDTKLMPTPEAPNKAAGPKLSNKKERQRACHQVQPPRPGLEYLGQAGDEWQAEKIAALKEELKPEIMRVAFKDSGLADNVVKTNAVQILRQAGIWDVKSL